MNAVLILIIILLNIYTSCNIHPGYTTTQNYHFHTTGLGKLTTKSIRSGQTEKIKLKFSNLNIYIFKAEVNAYISIYGLKQIWGCFR